MIGLLWSHEQRYGLHSFVVNHAWHLNSLWDRAVAFTEIWLWNFSLISNPENVSELHVANCRQAQIAGDCSAWTFEWGEIVIYRHEAWLRLMNKRMQVLDPVLFQRGDIVHCHVILQDKCHHTCLWRFTCHDNWTTQSGLWPLEQLLYSMDFQCQCSHFSLSGSSSHLVQFSDQW